MKTTNRRESILSKTEYDIMSIIWDINHLFLTLVETSYFLFTFHYDILTMQEAGS